MAETPNDTATDVQQIIAELQRKLAERAAEGDDLLLQQAASAEILGVINSSHGNLAPVFDAVLEKAMRLCDAAFGSLYTFDGEYFQTAAQRGSPAAWADYRAKNPPSGRLEGPFIRLLETKRPIHLPDIKAEEVYRNGTAAAHASGDLGGGRTVLYVSLLKDHAVLGTIVTYRQEVRPFTDKQIALLENFSAQAVIAMEHARLLGDLRQRSNDLQEFLQQQTATAEVLKAISRSAFDLESVLTTLTVSAKSLCGAASGVIFRREGDLYRYAASHMDVDPAYRAHEQQVAIQADRGTLIGRVALEKGAVQIADAWTDPEYEEKDEARLGNVRAMLGVPLLLSGEPIGAFALARRESMPFSQREVEEEQP